MKSFESIRGEYSLSNKRGERKRRKESVYLNGIGIGIREQERPIR